MKINKKTVQIALLTVIAGLVFGLITYVNQSACVLAFHQPKQPVNIQNKIQNGGSDYEKNCKTFFD